jgi:hypothetical protein
MIKRNKYGNHKVEIDGHKFDSKLEARYYNELKLLKQAGEIKGFSLQPKFELQPNYKRGNKTIRKITYSADFKVEHIDGEIEIIDIKGHITKEFALKRKMLEYKYNLSLTVLSFDKKEGWYEI